MASGSSGRANSGGSKGFDFASDDILCSYEDYGHDNQDGANGSHSDPSIGAHSKEFHKTRMSKSSMFSPTSYSPPEESSLNQDMISAVEKSMKKYVDNLMRFLEGISSRLSQLELYCYNLDKSIGEMRSDLDRDNGESDLKLKSIEKHLQEVHRSVQILRDKQELAETQKELAKLQLAQKESSTSSSVHQSEERATPQDAKKGDNSSDMHGQQLALALPHQVAPQPSLPSHLMEQPPQPPLAPGPPMPPQSMTQTQAYYLSPAQMATLSGPNQASQGQYMPSNSQYQASQVQDMSRMAPQPTQSQVNQTSQVQPIPAYPQQWPQQVQQVPQSSMQQQIKASSAAVYPPYIPSQPNLPSPEMVPNSSPMQAPYPGGSQSGASRPELMPYGYSGTGRPVQHQTPSPQQHLKPSYSTQPSDGYTVSGSHPALATGNTYIMYEGEGGRAHHPQQPAHFSQGGYPQASMSVQNSQPPSGPSMVIRPPQSMHNHPYNELIEKLVNMGYRGEHVVGVIQRLEENGQPVDFNAVLDRLNGHPSGGSQRGWSG